MSYEFRIIRINHPKYNVGLVHLLEGSLDADAFYHIGGLTDTCRIDEAERDATQVDGVFDHIAGRAVDVAHDGFLLVQQGIEQGGFAGIRLTDNRYRYTILDGIPYIERIGQTGDDLFNFIGYLGEFGTVGKLQFFVVAEVELELH